MNPEEYARMHATESDYWWFAGRRSIIAGLLKTVCFARCGAAEDAQNRSAGTPRLLDIGCGTGANLPMLLSLAQQKVQVVGVDFSSLALDFARSQAQAERLQLLQGDALHLPFKDNSFDAVTMLDVLEHLKDDHHALREVRRVLRPGGAIIWSVPAYKHLWSVHDEALHHFRRYEMPELRGLLRTSGFDVQRLSFAMSMMPPITWLWRRLVLQRKETARRLAPNTGGGAATTQGAVLPAVPAWLNRALLAYLNVESHIIPRRPLRFGTSLVGVAVKN